MITRACDYVDADIPADKIKACNDAAPAIRKPMCYDLRQQINNANSDFNAECVDSILANAQRITDSGSFDKVVTDYQKIYKKKRDDDAKRDRKERERDERERRDRERENNPTPPGNGGDCHRGEDPFGCQPR